MGRGRAPARLQTAPARGCEDLPAGAARGGWTELQVGGAGDLGRSGPSWRELGLTGRQELGGGDDAGRWKQEGKKARMKRTSEAITLREQIGEMTKMKEAMIGKHWDAKVAMTKKKEKHKEEKWVNRCAFEESKLSLEEQKKKEEKTIEEDRFMMMNAEDMDAMAREFWEMKKWGSCSGGRWSFKILWPVVVVASAMEVVVALALKVVMA
ncbi:hypothetical protein ZWY2020_030462 [Hordeum vulgare]|nr:hypothetical protein ZWY2020_030462 [Hordeum vulgare]